LENEIDGEVRLALWCKDNCDKTWVLGHTEFHQNTHDLKPSETEAKCNQNCSRKRNVKTYGVEKQHALFGGGLACLCQNGKNMLLSVSFVYGLAMATTEAHGNSTQLAEIFSILGSGHNPSLPHLICGEREREREKKKQHVR
jgi:hypothetical protein